MLSKDQTNVAADVLLEANKSPQPKPKNRFEFYQYRLAGGISGLLIALAISQVFNVKFVMIGTIFIVTGTWLGERIGKRNAKNKKGA